MAAWTGAAAAGAFLTKGLIALALPGAILLLWCWASGRRAHFLPLVFSPALPVFLALSLPWLLLAERRIPGFLQFFFIHEHLAAIRDGRGAAGPGPCSTSCRSSCWDSCRACRFSSPRPRRARGARIRTPSCSSSGSPRSSSSSRSRAASCRPTSFPAIPAAAALAAARRLAPRARRLWIVQAVAGDGLRGGAAAASGAARARSCELRLAAIVAPALAALVVASWAAVLFAARSLGAGGGGRRRGLGGVSRWASSSGWPRVPQAQLDRRARRGGARRGRRAARRADRGLPHAT